MLLRGATMLIRYLHTVEIKNGVKTPGNVEIGKVNEKTRFGRLELTLAIIQSAEGREASFFQLRLNLLRMSSVFFDTLLSFQLIESIVPW
jgi:hypothetical protein